MDNPKPLKVRTKKTFLTGSIFNSLFRDPKYFYSFQINEKNNFKKPNNKNKKASGAILQAEEPKQPV